MPIIPSVFQPIKSNDFQQRPVKVYKRYRQRSDDFNVDGGYVRHGALYRRHTPHILADTGQGVNGPIYLVNPDDNTNQQVVWNQIYHRYYKNYGPDRSADFLDIEAQERFLWQSASIFTAPYGQVGEKIKHGTYEVTSSLGSQNLYLYDDSFGNLRDPLIESQSFASSSRNFFYLSFNDMFLKYNDYDDVMNQTAYSGSGVTYLLNKVKKIASAPNGIDICPGVKVSGSRSYEIQDSGISARFNADQCVRIPHDAKFDRFGKCDDWTISLWFNTPHDTSIQNQEILSKYGTRSEIYLDKIDGKRKTRDIFVAPNTTFEKTRTPFFISADRSSGLTTFHFKASDGANPFHISSSAISVATDDWNHLLIRNSASICEMYIDGNTSGTTSGSLPAELTINDADVMIGAISPEDNESAFNKRNIAEIRMYDYAVQQNHIDSLANRNFISGSLYQTNVAGNVFYKNGQVVVSSPMPKYNTGSGAFGSESTWDITYRGTHTIYENECIVRVPKDQFNVSMNPSSTYKPVTVGDVCTVNQENVPPGEFRKHMFVSGTLKPYITSIGLYDDLGRMLAAAKLAQPIQKNPDVDMNFIIRWDY